MWENTITQLFLVMFMLLELCKSINRSELKDTRRALNYSGDVELKMIHGDEASMYEYTFMAALVRYENKKRRHGTKDSNRPGRLVCGAAIIHKDWILTAARCFDNNSEIEKFLVYAGVVDITKEDDQQIRAINNIHTHPQYLSSSDEFNLAMVRVTPSFRITINVRAGYLPTSPLSITSGERCHILGFAIEYETTDEEQTHEERLIKVQLHAIDHKDLLRRLKFLKSQLPYTLTDKNYGLIQIQDYPLNNSQGACEGDVGGPCICGFKIQGVIAHYTNKTCYKTGYPTTIVDVGYHLDWIRATVLQLHTVPRNMGVHNNNTQYIINILSFTMLLLVILNVI